MLNKKGQALVEYVLIIAIITVIAVAGVNFLGGYIKDAITKTSCSIMNQEFQQGKNPGDGICIDKKLDEIK